MCPSSGRPSAAVASGYGFDGPGPSSRRSVIGIRRAYATPRLTPFLAACAADAATRRRDARSEVTRCGRRSPRVEEELARWADACGRRRAPRRSRRRGARDAVTSSSGSSMPRGRGGAARLATPACRGPGGLPRARGVTERTVDGDGGPPPVDLVGRRSMVERLRDAVHVVTGQVARAPPRTRRAAWRAFSSKPEAEVVDFEPNQCHEQVSTGRAPA